MIVSTSTQSGSVRFEIVGFFPQLRLATRLADELYGAVHVHGGIFWPYVEPEILSNQFSGRFVLYGGGLLLTKRYRRLLLNAGLSAYGLRYGYRQTKTIIDEKTVKHLIPSLKRAGAQGIIEYPLNKVIY